MNLVTIFNDFLHNLQDLFLEFNRFSKRTDNYEANQEISLIQGLELF